MATAKKPALWTCSHDTGSSAGFVLCGQPITRRVYLRDTQNFSSFEVSPIVCRRLCCPFPCLLCGRTRLHS